MIQWKQRMYAFLLRRILGPFLDSSSQRKLHESIEVSLQEGTFALNNVGLSLSYLNSLDLGADAAVAIKKARVKSISIQLTLVEEQPADGANNVVSSSLAWRAMNLGSKVALVAHVDLDGVEVQVEPLAAGERTRKHSNSQSPPKVPETKPELHDSTTKNILSSYIEAALASLRLTFSVKDFSVRLCKKMEQGAITWVELRLPSIAYRDLDASQQSKSSNVQNFEKEAAHPILEKSVVFQGISIVAGEDKPVDHADDQNESFTSKLVSTVAVVEGSGQISVRAMEFQSRGKGTNHPDDEVGTQIQQDIDVRLHQQVKVSVDETSLRQIQVIAQGFQTHSVEVDDDDEHDNNSDEDDDSRPESSLCADNDQLEGVVDDMEHYTIERVMKQYEEARQLAGRNELRGGMLVPSSAFEEGEIIGEGDPRTFDVFFDANDKSFHHYASVMKESVLSQRANAVSDFVHTKIRLHLLGGGFKILFRNRNQEAATNPVCPVEYVLFKFNDLTVTTSLSLKGAEHSIHVSHVEIDDAQIEPSEYVEGDLFHGNKVEISNLLSFSQPEYDDNVECERDILEQPHCISVHASVTKDSDGKKQSDIEVNLRPCEVVYRHGTIPNLVRLLDALRVNEVQDSEERSAQQTEKASFEGETPLFRCNFASVTLALPLLRGVDCSALSERCCQSRASMPNATRPVLGVTLEHLSVEHKIAACDKGVGDSTCNNISSLECNSLLVFASWPDRSDATLCRKMQRLDILALTGRLEVDPYIPIAVEYKQNVISADCENSGKASFPVVPAFSSFKARQEDEDEDDDIDRVLSEKLQDVNVDTRKALRAKDPQNEMRSESAAAAAVLNIHIPEIMTDLSCEELKTFVAMIHCIIPNESGPNAAKPSSPEPSPSIAVSVACDTLSLSLHNKNPIEGSGWNSHLLRLDRVRVHTTHGGESIKYIRFLSHDTSFFEITDFAELSDQRSAFLTSVQDRVILMKKRSTRKSISSAVPIFYRSKLLPAISHTSPSILFDIIQPINEDDIEDREQSLYLSIYNMTHRYDPYSKWIERLQDLIASLANRDCAPEQNYDGEKAENKDVTSLTRVFVSLADCNLDYTSPKAFDTASRSVLRFGDLRVSSNLVSPAGSLQAFSISLGDISWYLCNSRYPHNFENSLLPGATDILAPEAICRPPQTGKTWPLSSEVAFRDMGFKTVLTLETMDAIIAKNSVASAETWGNKRRLHEPHFTISLTSGEVSIYACKDSFHCFTSTVSELQAKMTALGNKEFEELKLKSIDAPVSGDVCEQERFYDAQSKVSHCDFTPEVYLLDGYDWTTIDHDVNHTTEIPPGEEQVARWYSTVGSALSTPVADNGLESSDLSASMISNTSDTVPPKRNPSLRIIDQHFPLQVVSDPLDDGDMDAVKLAGGKSVKVQTRVLLHEMKVKVRLFDGYDWPECVRKPRNKPNGLFVIDEPNSSEENKSELGETGAAAPAPEKKVELMDGLLAGATDNESTFNDIPLPEERIESLLSQAELRRLSRRTNNYMQFSASGLRLRMDSYGEADDHRLKSCLNLAMADFFFAETISNSKGPVKMMGEWFNEEEHPRDSRDGLLMLKMVNWYPARRVTPENTVANDICEVEVNLAPMRCILDQRAVKFAKAFFGSNDEESSTNSKARWAAGLHLLPPPLMRMFRVKAVRLKIDYTPQRMDTTALKNGSVVELINISPLDAMVLTLNKVEIENVVGFGEAMSGLVGAWLADICATQMYKFLTYARPFEPLTNIGGGVADLFVLPWDAYRNGEKVSRAIRSSLSSLVGTVAHETLTTSSRLTEYIAGEMSRATAGSLAPNISQSSLPSRPLGTPRRLEDCAGHAFESLARGLQTANYKVIIVPYREYRRSGYMGAARGVVKGIPIAVAAPVGGASEAISYTLLGARNQIRPDIRKEEEACQRGLHYGSR